MTNLEFLQKYKPILSIETICKLRGIPASSLHLAITGKGKFYKPTQLKVAELIKEIKEDLNNVNN